MPQPETTLTAPLHWAEEDFSPASIRTPEPHTLLSCSSLAAKYDPSAPTQHLPFEDVWSPGEGEDSPPQENERQRARRKLSSSGIGRVHRDPVAPGQYQSEAPDTVNSPSALPSQFASGGLAASHGPVVSGWPGSNALYASLSNSPPFSLSAVPPGSLTQLPPARERALQALLWSHVLLALMGSLYFGASFLLELAG